MKPTKKRVYTLPRYLLWGMEDEFLRYSIKLLKSNPKLESCAWGRIRVHRQGKKIVYTLDFGRPVPTYVEGV